MKFDGYALGKGGSRQ